MINMVNLVFIDGELGQVSVDNLHRWVVVEVGHTTTVARLIAFLVNQLNPCKMNIASRSSVRLLFYTEYQQRACIHVDAWSVEIYHLELSREVEAGHISRCSHYETKCCRALAYRSV